MFVFKGSSAACVEESFGSKGSRLPVVPDPLLTVTDTGALSPRYVSRRLSYARAVRVCRPSSACVVSQDQVKGALVFVAIGAPSTENVTMPTDGSVVVLTATVPLSVAPEVGEEILICGEPKPVSKLSVKT